MFLENKDGFGTAYFVLCRRWCMTVFFLIFKQKPNSAFSRKVYFIYVNISYKTLITKKDDIMNFYRRKTEGKGTCTLERYMITFHQMINSYERCNRISHIPYLFINWKYAFNTTKKSTIMILQQNILQMLLVEKGVELSVLWLLNNSLLCFLYWRLKQIFQNHAKELLVTDVLKSSEE